MNCVICDICSKPAHYALEDEGGEVTGEFCRWHAILYDISNSGGDVILEAPFEIRFFSQWALFIPAGIISICLVRLFPKFFRFFGSRK